MKREIEKNAALAPISRCRFRDGFRDGFVHFTPEADYAGSEAGFDYVARASNDTEWRLTA